MCDVQKVQHCEAEKRAAEMNEVSSQYERQLCLSYQSCLLNSTYIFITIVIITSVKEVMFLPDFVCLFVCVLAK